MGVDSLHGDHLTGCKDLIGLNWQLRALDSRQFIVMTNDCIFREQGHQRIEFLLLEFEIEVEVAASELGACTGVSISHQVSR